MSVPAASRPDLYAHRGTALLAPENTIAAFDMACLYGADVLEVDVRLSRDGVVYVTHDERVDRTSNGRGCVASLDSRDIDRLDAGYRYTRDNSGRQDPDFPFRGLGLQILRLDALFDAYPDRRINIDIKDNHREAARAVAELIRRKGVAERINVGSFFSTPLKAFRDYAPMVTTAAGLIEVAELYFSPRQRLERKAGSRGMAFEYLQIPMRWKGIDLTRPGFISHMQALGLKMVYWTVNDEDEMRRLASLGVDGVVSDRVDLLATVLHGRLDG